MKIALIGYGKMGKTIEQIAISRGHEIVSRIDIDNQEDFNSEEFKSADVAIEFTAPKVAVQNYIKAFNSGVSVVSGTTGRSPRTNSKLTPNARSKERAFSLYAPQTLPPGGSVRLSKNLVSWLPLWGSCHASA